MLRELQDRRISDIQEIVIGYRSSDLPLAGVKLGGHRDLTRVFITQPVITIGTVDRMTFLNIILTCGWSGCNVSRFNRAQA